jgi:hypothetical protein
VIRQYEFDPKAAPIKDGALRIDSPQVEQALNQGKAKDQAASSATGWDATAPVPWTDMQGG